MRDKDAADVTGASGETAHPPSVRTGISRGRRVGRWVVGAGILIAVLAMVVRWLADTAPDSDIALIDISVLRVISGWQGVGLTSRFGWSHPGPLASRLLIGGPVSIVIPLSRIARTCAIVAVLGAAACRAAAPEAPSGYAGTWVMTLGTRVFLVMTIEQQDQAFAARIQGPSSFGLPAVGAALRYSDVTLPIRERRTSSAADEGDHLHLVLVDPDHPDEPDDLDFTLSGTDGGALQLSGVPVAPLTFTRHTGPAPAVATDWDVKQTYHIVEAESEAPNADMAAIFEEDQRVRQGGLSVPDADWSAIEKGDAERRQRAVALLAAGALHTSDDYRKAAFVFQHGGRPDDYLLAHTLALVALAKGDSGSAWIAAATLDRYLQSVRQPQIYGTQFNTAGPLATQDAYNQALISDALRNELGVPTIAGQAAQMKALQPAAKPAR